MDMFKMNHIAIADFKEALDTAWDIYFEMGLLQEFMEEHQKYNHSDLDQAIELMSSFLARIR
jgi:hypothetical protein